MNSEVSPSHNLAITYYYIKLTSYFARFYRTLTRFRIHNSFELNIYFLFSRNYKSRLIYDPVGAFMSILSLAINDDSLEI